MLRVVTPRIWVSPRSNSAEPWTRGITPTSECSGRMSARPRPSMRILSRSTRWRTSDLFSERNAAPISFSRPSNWPASFSTSAALISSTLELALLLVGDGHRGGGVVLRGGLDGGVDVVLVVEEDREVLDRLGGLGGELGLRLDELLDEGLGGVEATGHDLLGRRLGAALDEGDGVLGGLGLDHHDGDVTGLGDATGDDHVEDGRLELRVARERDPLALDERHADAADGAGERQAGELGRQRRGVDRQHVVGHVGVERHDGDDDLDLVAQALLEGRAQRAVDEAAGEDRVLARATLGAEEGAGDLAHGVHPLLDVDREGEEVEVVLGRLARGRRREQHGLVVEVGRDGAGGLTGEQAGLELDRALAELAVVEDGLDSGDDGFTHGSRILLSLRGAIRGVHPSCGGPSKVPRGRSSIEARRSTRPRAGI